ncbi:Hypothetical protein LUCI_4790 [Lucifera butyrica]|uniref:Uncharacterized protein n=1 Tax=Lucifera butyrica TaxID=1351585 RepID=A0A498REQ8_9FIRM|nr:tetratricopeptide repeat protein [Lucifera butyrica]VBB09495.1 Hypothetical protein LUCI_4790 [Lucifera butyrica]
MIGILSFLPLLWMTIKSRSPKFSIGGLLGSGIWIIIAWFLLSDSYLLFNQSANTVTINERNFWSGRTSINLPLDQVKDSTIEYSRGTHRIVLVLQNGQHVGFTGFSDQDGQFEAENAIRDYLHARDEKEKTITMYFNRALVEQSQAEYEQAIADYNKIIAMSPKAWDAYINRGNNFDALEQTDRALADYRKAAELNPKAVNAYFNAAIIYERLHQTEKAVQFYQKALPFMDDQTLARKTRAHIEELQAKPVR